MRNYIMEFLGTFFLVLAIGLTEDPIAFGVMLMAMVYIGGHISGAHYNPAISLGVYLRGKLSSALLPGYMLAQTAGAFIAAAVFNHLAGKMLLPTPSPDFALWEVAAIEALFAFVLVAVVLTVATSTKVLRNNDTYGLVIGFTLFTLALSGRMISGGVYNPAIVVGSALFSALKGGDVALNGKVLLAYILGPLAGGAIAAYAYKHLNPEE